MQRVQDAQAFVLHRRDFRETSLLLDLFTIEHGRVTLVARGVRARKRRAMTELEPYVPLRIGWSRRGELGTLTAHEATANAIPLLGRALWCGFYVNELILRLLHRDEPNEQAFTAYIRALTDLLQAEPAVALRRFEWHLLCAAGYGFDPRTEAGGESVDPAGNYRWSPGVGIQTCLPGTRGAVSGTALLALADDQVGLEAARALLADAISEQLDGRPLKTGPILRQMKLIKEGGR